MDLTPEGTMTLTEAFERYCLWLWSGHSPFDEIGLPGRLESLPLEPMQAHRAAADRVTDLTLSEIVGPFAGGSLEALVQEPGRPENLAIPASAWREAFFPERMFLSDEIGSSHGPYFDRARGRTPFVSRDKFEDWLRGGSARRSDSRSAITLRDLLIGLVMDGVMTSKDAEDFASNWGLRALRSRPGLSEYDPAKLATWTLAMTVSWIVWRGFSSVREAQDDYRANWWEWFSISRRVPLDGGREWYEVHGAELRTLGPLTVSDLGMLEALDNDPVEGRKQMSVKSAREDLWRRLSEHELEGTAVARPGGGVVVIPAREWTSLELNHKIDPDDSLRLKHAPATLAYTHISLQRADVLRLWPSMSGLENGDGNESSPPFDLADPDWKLWDAAQWVGCKGRLLSSEEIADGHLDDMGAEVLFAALLQEKLVATGLTQKRVREAIPALYWEMATIDPGLYGKRHYVSFIDETLGDYGGQFTPVGEADPRWFGIRVKRYELFAVFPEFAPLPSLKSASKAEVTKVVPTASNRQAAKLDVTRKALAEIFPHGPPRGLSVKDRLKAVNEWHGKNGSSIVSAATVLRALKAK